MDQRSAGSNVTYLRSTACCSSAISLGGAASSGGHGEPCNASVADATG